MAVKSSQSASRVLATLEKIAEHQPIGVSELARLLEEDISAVQRALMTLAHDSWICAAPGKPTRWELTARIHAVAHAAHGTHPLRQRARPVLEELRDGTGETASLNVPELGRFMISDVVESRHFLRVVLTVGATVPNIGSATARAILPYMSDEQQTEFLPGPPSATEVAELAATVSRGYAISRNVVVEGFTNIAAPVFEADGRPIGAVLVTGPNERLPPEHHGAIGGMVCAAARKLSRGPAPLVAVGSADLRQGSASPLT
jgi:IclR family acetate operon transcriptional repressor